MDIESEIYLMNAGLFLSEAIQASTHSGSLGSKKSLNLKIFAASLDQTNFPFFTTPVLAKTVDVIRLL